MTKIIKKNGKYYRQIIQEYEVYLKDLEGHLLIVRSRKSKQLIEQTKDFDDQIAKIQNEISQLKAL